jgi:hypothetical protein
VLNNPMSLIDPFGDDCYDLNGYPVQCPAGMDPSCSTSSQTCFVGYKAQGNAPYPPDDGGSDGTGLVDGGLISFGFAWGPGIGGPGSNSGGGQCVYVLQNPCSTPTPQTKQQKCAAAKASLAAVNVQGQALTKMNFKEMGYGALIGCGVGAVGTEEVFPVVGTPLAVGDCAVGAIGGAMTAEGVFVLSNFGDLVSGSVSEAKAVAQIVQNCF